MNQKIKNNVNSALELLADSSPSLLASIKGKNYFVCAIEDSGQDYVIIDCEQSIDWHNEDKFVRNTLELYNDFCNVEKWYRC